MAFKALCQSTHLYGRRLVLEWAQKEDAIDEIRKRTARHFHEGNFKTVPFKIYFLFIYIFNFFSVWNIY